ncbi:helix-turn-helix domain-containing protein [Cohnella sp. JJ-181]|uniref:helix-turn-helix domain-containing protein n=1 Tax=Cohnella rhizoplanae TaxID=2974897 RepID=UPI0022FFA8C3|nr:helix-turn-helix domain-containing protein [Cohnella sp. JJ-181]CAI6066610.1 Regulator of RpoS [Cohnella sp. JJ-181]
MQPEVIHTYKLMIVEDEPLIREGLKLYFDWPELGVTEIFEAENGTEGIEVALRERPDLVLTDIRMPELGGLEMIERLHPALPDARYVILTGYNDFAYAQQAIRLGRISAYLLKPLQYEESLAAIRDCLEALAAERAASAAGTLRAEAHDALQGGLLVKSLLDGEDDGRAERWLASAGFDTPLAYRPLVLAYIPEIGAQAGHQWQALAEALLGSAVSALYPDCPGTRTLCYFHRRTLYALAIVRCEGGAADLAPDAARIEQAMRESAGGLAPCFYLSAGAAATVPGEAAGGWRQAERLLIGRFFYPDRRFFAQPREAPVVTGGRPPHGLDPKDKAMLAACLAHEQSDAEETRRWLRELGLRSAQADAKQTPDRWLALIQEIVGDCLRFAYKHGIEVEEIYSVTLLDLSFVADFRDAERLFGWLAEWIVQLGAVYRAGKSRPAPQDALIFEQIEAFVTQRLNEDVTLQMVADRFYYNPSYLSRLFKSKLNINYLAFVTEIRVRHAKRYLENPKLLVTEVCAMCGYKSYKHFVKTFRSVAGMSPTEYRKQMGT